MAMRKDQRAYHAKADLCMHSMISKYKNGSHASAKKPTIFMTSSLGIADVPSMRCEGNHIHQHLTGGRAEDAAIYPQPLCRAICRGMGKQLDMENANMVPTKAVKLQKLSNINENSGAKKDTRPALDGIQHHWRDEVHEQEGVQACKKRTTTTHNN